MKNDKDFYKLSEITKMLGFSESKIRTMIKRKEIPAYQIGREYRFNVKEIRVWLRAKQVA